MKVEVRGEDVVIVGGAEVLNPSHSRELGWQLVTAAAQAEANGRLLEEVQAKEDAARAMGGGGKVVDAEMPFPIASAPAKPQHNVAVFLAAGVIQAVEIVEGCPPRIQQPGYHSGSFIYALESSALLGPGQGVTVLFYSLKERG